MFALTAHITIDKYEFNHVNYVEITSNRTVLGEKATIKLPRRYANKYVNGSTKLSDVIKAGQKVSIQLGYDGNYTQQWNGYVSNITPSVPFVIECEDEAYTLKREYVQPIVFASATLKEVIQYILKDSKVEYSLDVPDLKLTNFPIKGKRISKYYALDQLNNETNLDLDIFFRNSKLFCGLPYTEKYATTLKNVVYNLSGAKQNVISNNLKYRNAADVKIKLKLISLMPDNSKIECVWGDADGEVRTWHEFNKSLKELQTIAQNRLDKLKFDGYVGSLTTFGIPFPVHTQIAELRDEEFNDHNGKYYIDAVRTTFGDGGYRHEVTIGRKVK